MSSVGWLPVYKLQLRVSLTDFHGNYFLGFEEVELAKNSLEVEHSSEELRCDWYWIKDIVSIEGVGRFVSLEPNACLYYDFVLDAFWLLRYANL